MAASTSLVAAALSLERLRKIQRQRLRDAADLERTLRRTSTERRLEALAVRDDWLGALAAELRDEPNGERQLVAVNLSLDERANALELGESWPGTGLRLALLGALLGCSLAAVLHTLAAVLPIVIVGAVGALVSLECGRRAARVVKEERAVIDKLVDLIAPSLVQTTSHAGALRSRSRRRRR